MAKKKLSSYTYELTITGAKLNAQQRKWLAEYAADMANPGGDPGVKCIMSDNPKVS